jgi:hypothetical protein
MEIYRLYAEEGLSCQEIAARLTSSQVPTRTGCRQWSPSTVRGILRNETYAGVWHDNKRRRDKGANPSESWIPVSVPSIISRDLWQAAQERIAANRERLRRRSKYPYLLSGILRCGNCGRAIIGMTSVPNRDRRPKPYHYYRCTDSTRTWKHERCLETKLHAEEADALVWEKIAEALRNPELLLREYNRQVENGNDIKAPERLSQIDRELIKLKRKQDRNLDLYVEGLVDMLTLKKHQETVRGQRASLVREREALQRVLERNSTDMPSVNEFCQLISNGLDSVTFEEKRQILRLLNIEGRVKDGTLQNTQQLSTGVVLWKARDEGNRLVPWVTAPKLPFDLTDAHPVAKELRLAFEALVEEADLKFRGYDPYRLLLIATSQSGLDLEFHAGRFKDGKGTLLAWMDALCERINNIDAIFLEPGVNVWSAEGKVMAGHKYIESKAGHYPELWRRSGVPRLLV